jgi:hypothetical protein
MTWRLENVLDRLSAFDGEAERRSNEEAEVKGDLDPKDRNPFVRGDKPLRPAAVLVPLVNRPQGATVLLTKRTDHLNNHAGQISFPRSAKPRKRSVWRRLTSTWSVIWTNTLSARGFWSIRSLA